MIPICVGLPAASRAARHATLATVILSALLFAATTAGAQSPNPCLPAGATAGAVTGTIADAQGGRIQGATVTVRCPAGALTVVSAADGTFTLQLAPGAHTVHVTLDGFASASRAVTIASGAATPLDVVLEVASLSDAVTVRAEATTVVRQDSTATRTSTPLIETPQSVTVVTAEQIADQASPNVQEVLRYTAGVRNETYGIDNRGDWFSLRGSDQSTTLLNGMRLPLSGWYGVVREEPYAFSQMAVVRGPASIIAGQNDPGGVLNLVSKRPQADAANEVSLRVGNFSQPDLQFDSTGPLNANRSLLYRFVATGKNADTQIQYADEHRVFLAPSLTWRGARGSLTGYAEYQHDRSRNTNAFLPREGTLDPAPNGPIPTDLFIGEPDWDRYGGTRWRGGYEGDLTLAPSWHLRQSFRYDHVDGLMKSMYAAWWDGFLDGTGTPDPDGQYLGRYWYLTDDRTRITATEALLEGRRTTGRIVHTLLFGLDGSGYKATQISAEDLGTPLNVYSPTYGTFAEPSFGDAVPTDSTINRFGFFAQDQMRIADRLSVRAGVRRDRVGNTVDEDPAIVDWATTGNIGVVYEVVPGLAPYVSYSQSFDPVAGTDADGEAFRPKRGEQVEGGLKWEGQKAPVQASAAYYAITERNRLMTDPDDFNKSIQVGEAKIKGLETEARGEVASWTTMASYTWTHARADAPSYGGLLDPTQQLEAIPEHQANFWALYDFARFDAPGLRAGGGIRYVGRVGDGTGTTFVPAVTLFDLNASYTVRTLRFSLNINNLTDKPYIATCLSRGDCWFGQRRTVALTTTVGF